MGAYLAVATLARSVETSTCVESLNVHEYLLGPRLSIGEGDFMIFDVARTGTLPAAAHVLVYSFGSHGAYCVYCESSSQQNARNPLMALACPIIPVGERKIKNVVTFSLGLITNLGRLLEPT